VARRRIEGASGVGSWQNNLKEITRKVLVCAKKIS
jgi:hypothetical protein